MYSQNTGRCSSCFEFFVPFLLLSVVTYCSRHGVMAHICLLFSLSKRDKLIVVFV